MSEHSISSGDSSWTNPLPSNWPGAPCRRTIELVLADGRGSRRKALTDRVTAPAVYFGDKLRIIDFALSNCLNSGVRRIGVLIQYKSHSLLRHGCVLVGPHHPGIRRANL